MKQIFLFAIFLLMLSFSAFSQEDADGCKDHSLFNRLSNFFIPQCTKNYNEVQVHTSAVNTIAKEGNVTKISYSFNNYSGATAPSPFQVIKNYENAILKNGGKKIYSSTGDDGYQGATFSFTKNGAETWVMIDNMTPGLPDVCDGFELYVIEMEAMTQEISANDIFDALNKDGFIALYINFESGKSEIKPESQKIIAQIAEMLNTNPTIKVSIDGHTDNVGTPESNKILSENRAKAVLSAIVTNGIDKSRLSAKGFGQEKPIADNRTEDGKAKNRRVEIVKK